MKMFDVTRGATRKDGAVIAKPGDFAPRSANSETSTETSLWYRRPGILIAAAALTTGVGIVVSAPGQPDAMPTGTLGTNTPRTASFSLIATDYWEPPPDPPPAAPAPEPAPAPRQAPAPVAAPPPPPPPPPPQLVVRLDSPVTAAFVSMTNHANGPAVGCTMRTVALAGPAAMVNYGVPDNQFTITGSEEARVPAGASLGGPTTGSTWRVTVTCDNGLTGSQDAVY